MLEAGNLTIVPPRTEMPDSSAWPHGHCGALSLSLSLCSVCQLISVSSPVSPLPWDFIPFPIVTSHSELVLTPLIGITSSQENRYVVASSPGSHHCVIFLVPHNSWASGGLFPGSGGPFAVGRSCRRFHLLLGHLPGLLGLGVLPPTADSLCERTAYCE